MGNSIFFSMFKCFKFSKSLKMILFIFHCLYLCYIYIYVDLAKKCFQYTNIDIYMYVSIYGIVHMIYLYVYYYLIMDMDLMDIQLCALIIIPDYDHMCFMRFDDDVLVYDASRMPRIVRQFPPLWQFMTLQNSKCGHITSLVMNTVFFITILWNYIDIVLCSIFKSGCLIYNI